MRFPNALGFPLIAVDHAASGVYDIFPVIIAASVRRRDHGSKLTLAKG
jgi:hypothetical protein